MGSKNFFFFVDADQQPANHAINIQTATDPLYGPVTTGAAPGMDEYRVTSLHTATFDPTAYAVCDGTVCVQKIPSTTLVNIILKPRYQPPLNFAPVKYFIYKGIKAGSLIASNGTEVADATTNNLTQLAWTVQNAKNAKDGTSANPPANALGVGLTGTGFADDDPIDNLFYRTGVLFQLLDVEGGWKIGQFDKAKFGIEVLMEGLNFRHTLKLTRQIENRISVPTLAATPTEAQIFDHWHTKEQILGFMDPCAFYGSFFRVGVQAKTSGNVPFVTKVGSTLYQDVLFPFYNRNKVYLDIRNEHNFSFNYFQNYGTTIMLGTSTTAVDYYAGNWPLLTLTTPNFAASNTTVARNALALQLPVGDNLIPLVYVSQGYRDINSEGDGFPAELKSAERFFADFDTPVGGYTVAKSATGPGALTLAVPNVTGQTATTPVSCYIRLKYLKQQPQTGTPAVSTLIQSANYLDNLIWPIDLSIPFVGSASIKSAVYDEEVYVNAQNEAGLGFDCIATVGIASDADNTTLFLIPTNVRTKSGKASDLVALTGETNDFPGYYPNFIALKYFMERIVKNNLTFSTGGAPVATFVSDITEVRFTVPDFDKIFVIVVANAAYTFWKNQVASAGVLDNRFRIYLGIKNLQALSDAAGKNYTAFELVLRGIALDANGANYEVREIGTDPANSANLTVYAYAGN